MPEMRPAHGSGRVMSRRRKTSTDLALEEWARQRRRIVGVEHPMTAREFIGAVRSTLGSQRDLHANSKSNRRSLSLPEVYVGRLAQAVNAAYWAANPQRKWILDVHYVIPGKAGEKHKVVGLSTTTYFRLVDSARSFVEGRLSHEN